MILLQVLFACGPKAIENRAVNQPDMVPSPSVPAVNSNSSEKRKQVDLEFKDIPMSMSEEHLIKKVGKPLKTRTVKRSAQCSDGPSKIFAYPGLTVELIYDSEGGAYKVFILEATSNKWPTSNGMAVGAEVEDALAVAGEPPLRRNREDTFIVRHETGSGPDNALLYFRGGKLSKIKIGYKECLDEN
jgi:hypothetical protein